MSEAEATPRSSRRGRPPAASASKAPEDKKTPSSRSRSTKKMAEETAKKGLKAEKEPEPAPAATPADSDDEVKIVKTVKPKPNFKSKATIKKEVDEDDPAEEAVDAAVADEQPTSSSRSTPRKEKKKEADKTTKPTRGGRANEPAMEEDEEEEEPRGSRTASRSTRKGKKDVEEEEEEEVPKEKKVAASRSTKKGRKEAAAAESDEEEEQTDKRKKAHPTRKGKKAAEEEEDDDEEEEPVREKKSSSRAKVHVWSDEEDEVEEEEEPVREKKTAARSTRKGKKPVESEEEEEEEESEKNKRTASRSTRKEKKVHVWSEDEEEPPKEKKPAARSARKNKKGHVSSEDEGETEDKAKKGKGASSRAPRRGKKAVVESEEEEEMEEAPAKNKKTAARSPSRGKRAMERDAGEEEDDGEEEEMESPKKKAKVTVAERGAEEEQGTSTSRARRRINLDDDEGVKAKKKDEEKAAKKVVAKKGKALRPIETPRKKTQEERKAERAARRAERGDDDIEVLEEEDVKPLIRFKPQFVDDIDEDKSMRRSASHHGDDDDDEDSDEIMVDGTVGVPAASDVKMKKATREACISICITIRTALRSVYISKDDRAFNKAVQNIVYAQRNAYGREDYEYAARTFYDEIENQLVNMMMKDEREAKSDFESKQRVLKVIAKAAMAEFEEIDEDQYGYYWNQIHYLLGKFACATDGHIRANFCAWVASLMSYSKENHRKEHWKNTLDEMEEMHAQRLKDAREKMTAEQREMEGDVDYDRRFLDGHMLKLTERKRLFVALYTSLKHPDAIVRMAAVRAFSVIQDDPIPATFTEAVRHSPKDLIMRQLMDVHMNVRRVAIEELRPKSDEQIEFLISAAMQEKHVPVRIAAFAKLGRLNMLQFTKPQRHALLAMLRDNVLGKTIEQKVLHPWLYEMVYGENPHPIVSDDRWRQEDLIEVKKKSGGKKNWALAPLRLLTHLDCINHLDDALEILKKGSNIARKELGLEKLPVSKWITQVIGDADHAKMNIMTKTECQQLLDREMDDATRATIISYWLHCLQFVHTHSKDEGDRYAAVDALSPSMGELHRLVLDLLEDEKERRAPRKQMIESGHIDVTHPACQPTAASLQSVVALLLSAFRYLEHGDTVAMDEWHDLLKRLTRGDHCDLSPAIWEIVMHDLLKFHTKENERDDLIYEVATGMGFDFDDVTSAASKRDKSPKRHSKTPAKKGARDSSALTPTTSHPNKEAYHKRMEAKRIVIARPDCLGMIHGALKTALFNSSSDSFNIVFKTEMDTYRSISDNRLHALCLECIGMFGPFSEEMSQKYMDFVLENLTKEEPVEDEEEERLRDNEERLMRRKKNVKVGVSIDELEVEYQRRMREETERREAEERSNHGGINHCVGMALVVITDLIVAHSLSKVVEWMQSGSSSGEGKKWTDLVLFEEFEKLAHNPDLELAFKVAHCMCKLAMHDRELMRCLNRTAAKLQFRALHPTSFSHPKYRSCVVEFFKHFGPKSTANQMAMVEMVITMLKMLKDRPHDCRHIIDRGNAAYAVSVVVWSCAPSSLKPPASGVRPANTAHGSMLAKLKVFLERCGEEAREAEPIDMDYYKAILGAVGGSQFSKQKGSLIRDIYDLLYTNADLMEPWDKGGEVKKMTQKITKLMDKHLDCINEIIRLNKAIGVTLTDDQAILPFEDEEERVIFGMKEKAREMGMDERAVSPVKDSRASRAGSAYGKTPRTKKRAAPERGLMSTLKKEPAKSKSFAAQAAADRKEAAAASSAQSTPARSRAHLNRKRPTKMPTIDESDSD